MSTAFFDTVVAQPGKKRVTTTLRGYYSGPFANTGFELDIHDTLGIDSNKFLTCKTTTALDMETTVDTVLNDIFHAAFIHGDDFARLIGQGPACYAVESLPKQWLLPGKVGENLGLKQVFRWTRFKVDNSGLHLGGTHSTEARVPAVTIKGPDPLKVELGDPIAGVYKAEVTDLRPPITYQWTSQNAVASGSGPTTTLTWNITLHNNQYVSRVIHVTATDADGIKASASRTVQIRRVVSSDLPDFCAKKPWSPECDYGSTPASAWWETVARRCNARGHPHDGTMSAAFRRRKWGANGKLRMFCRECGQLPHRDSPRVSRPHQRAPWRCRARARTFTLTGFSPALSPPGRRRAVRRRLPLGVPRRSGPRARTPHACAQRTRAQPLPHLRDQRPG